MEKGVVVASTHHIEWLLPWWWYHFRLHNSLPVAFLDLGLSDECKEWCKERGKLIPVEIPPLDLSKETVEPSLARKWEETHGTSFWDVRLKWFLKPFAFIQSPFQNTLWLDLDCEVRAPVDSLFAHCENEGGIALAREPEARQRMFSHWEFILPGEVVYNSGVVVYRRDSPLISEWVQEVLTNNHCYRGDQDALSRVLFQKKLLFSELPEEWNWARGLGQNPEALIFHWYGQDGKRLLREEIDMLAIIGVLNPL